MIHIDKQTRQRVLAMPGTCDIMYDLNGDSAISNEDIPLTGNWEDYTGSDTTINSKAQLMWAGTENELWGTDAQIESMADLNQLTDRGNSANTTRKRIIKRYVKLGN